ncbi:MAG TPA: hypothetical protein VNC50_07370, partial [Planctomycetia bacterium]|nr:hypothetical protein [Planctomycetia bacterium]
DETGPKKTLLPKALDARPRDSAAPPTREVRVETFLPQPFEATPGFSGPSGVLPTEEMPNPRPGTNLFQLGLPPNQDPRFLPIEDRWRLAPSAWDRYGRGFRDAEGRRDDYQLIEGHWWDPYNQNVLKGDYPILGNHIFMNLTAANIITAETRQVPTATTPFESTRSPRAEEFFGSGVQFFYNNDLRLTLNLFQGEGAFKPFDWNVQLTPVMNFNAITVKELAQVVPDVRRGVTRERTFLALEEYFVETKIADLSEAYDFMSFRAGSQFFVSDFRGFIFSDTNRGFRLFGNNNANRDQFNAAVFLMAEKDTNSGLNTFNDRKQQVLIANYYRQDFIVPGYTAQASFHYNRDGGNFKFDKNNNLVRPDPAGVFAPHNLDICYLGLTGDGHIGRYNITNAFYWAFGRDSLNPLAGRGVDVSAYMAALELSYDRDWARFRSSFFFSSGDGNISNDKATGFDSILDNPQFAGGQFSYWQRQQIRILGLAQVNRNSLIPDLRSSKLQGQANFVNPGLHLFNLGMDMDLTPKLRSISNVNWLFFDKTNVLEQFVFQGGVERYIGTDISTGIEYRPRLSNNIIFLGGVSTLIPGTGFRDVFNRLDRRSQPLLAAFFNLTLAY